MKYIKLLFSHLFIVTLAIILQIGVIIVLLERLNEYYAAVQVVLTVLSIVIAVNLINRNMNPDYKIPWLFLVLAIPLFGIVLYLMFSKNYLTIRQQKKLKLIRKKNEKNITVSKEEDEVNKKELKEYYGQNKFIENSSNSKAYKDTETKYFKSGEEFFLDLISELKLAKDFIFMEYFIIEEGKMFNTILDILKEKVQEGVDVRLIYDDVGCASKVKINYAKTLQSYGIKCYVFNPFIPVVSGMHNNRDHRKITVIDGKVGYTGGINLADEYINEISPFGHWKDSSIKLIGKGVNGLTLMFLNNYEFITKENDDYKKYLEIEHKTYENQGYVHPFGDGPRPIDDEQIGENVYINILNNAKDYVYITTPYLIIDFNLINALRNAALRGVDVRIITPHIPDKKIVLNLTRSYYKELLNAGIKIYEYEPGFIHAKNFISDDKVGVVGTINLDYRSLVHHYECGVFMVNTPSILDIKEDFINTQNESIEIPKDFKLNIFISLLNYILKFFTPLL